MRGLMVHTDLIEIEIRDGMNEETDDDLTVHMNDTYIAVGGLKMKWEYAAPLLWAVLFDGKSCGLADGKTDPADVLAIVKRIRIENQKTNPPRKQTNK